MNKKVLIISPHKGIPELSKDGLPTLAYKGHFGILKRNKRDRNRIYGFIVNANTPAKMIKNVGFAGNNIEEVSKRFMRAVNNNLDRLKYRRREAEWKKVSDWRTISLVYNILPDQFKKRIESKEFDATVIEKVSGGDYEVPLYYVTKAWDYILNSNLGVWTFKIDATNIYMDRPPTEDDIAEFIAEEKPDRMRKEAREHNNQIKSMWKEYFNIDIDALEIDFKQFNMHMYPQVSEEKEYDYFHETPDGLDIWVLIPVNHPDKKRISFDYVSSLMEFCAYLQRDLEEYADSTFYSE